MITVETRSWLNKAAPARLSTCITSEEVCVVEIGMMAIEKTPFYLRWFGHSPRRRKVSTHRGRFSRWSYGW